MILRPSKIHCSPWARLCASSSSVVYFSGKSFVIDVAAISEPFGVAVTAACRERTQPPLSQRGWHFGVVIAEDGECCQEQHRRAEKRGNRKRDFRLLPDQPRSSP